jgi:hypothetical protein
MARNFGDTNLAAREKLLKAQMEARDAELKGKLKAEQIRRKPETEAKDRQGAGAEA